MLHPHNCLRLLCIVGNKVPSRSKISGNQAGSIAFYLLAALAITVGSLAIASSSSRSLLRSAFQGESREAKEAALAGVDTIIGDLNQHNNRRLLVTEDELNSWSVLNTSECPAPRDASNNPIAPLIPTALSYGNNTEQSLQGDPNRRFVLRSVQKIANKSRVTPYDEDQITIDGDENNVGYIRLTVEGRVYRNNQQIATSTVTREFEIVPKCCGKSFGLPKDTSTGIGVHGIDERSCSGPGTGEPGVMVYNDLKYSGTAAEIVSIDENGQQVIDNILCAVVSSSSNCDSLLQSKYNPVQTQLGDVALASWDFTDTPPTYPGGYAGAGAKIVDANPKTNQNEIQVQCLRSTSSGVTAYNDSNCTIVVPNFSSNFCSTNTPSGTNNCLIDSISYAGGINLTVQTQASRLRLFVTGNTKFNGNSALLHSRDTDGDGNYEILTIDQCLLGTGGPASEFVNNLEIYDTQAAPSQTLDLGTGGTSALGLFIWAPYSTVNLTGNAEICGKIWAGTLTYNGSISIVTPPSAFTDSDGDGLDDNGNIRQDFIARSTKSFRGF